MISLIVHANWPDDHSSLKKEKKKDNSKKGRAFVYSPLYVIKIVTGAFEYDHWIILNSSQMI